MSRKQKLELTWIGKDNRPRLEPRILVEDRDKSYHAAHRVTDHDIFDISEVREGVAPRTWWSADEVGTNQQAKRDHLNKLLPDIEPFATPKPEGLLQRIVHIATNPGDVVLDSFAGSGTTGAVAHKMDEFLNFWQTRRDGARRGIVEVTS